MNSSLQMSKPIVHTSTFSADVSTMRETSSITQSSSSTSAAENFLLLLPSSCLMLIAIATMVHGSADCTAAL